MRLRSLASKIQSISEKSFIKTIKNLLLKPHFLYKNYLRLLKGVRFSSKIVINIPWINTTLKSRQDLSLAIKTLKKSRLKLHPNVLEKNWDSLIALSVIIQNTDKSKMILDAGGERSSLILLWLYQLGYYNLKCMNLTFKKRTRRGNIEFIPGDLTKTDFPNNYFDAITCISVIEHGVDEDKYFKEMNRILKDGGILITSTDYWETRINTDNLVAYNNPVFVYDKDSVEKLLEKAYNNGFKLYGPDIDLECQDKVVTWKKFDLKFTFIIFCIQKKLN